MNLSLLSHTQMPTVFVHDHVGQYRVTRAITEQDILQAAQFILKQRVVQGEILNSVALVKAFLMARLGTEEHEIFCVLFLNTQNRLIACDQMFRGTIDSATVYPREVVKRALQLNAAAVIFAHNHPSGCTTPSGMDKSITCRLEKALALVGIRVLDHLVVTTTEVASFAEMGFIEEVK